MGASRELIDAVVGGAEDRLQDFGFTRRRYVRTVEVAPGVLGSVGLNRSEERGDHQLLINPVLGVHHQAVEREVARLCGEKFDPYFPATISAPLSQLARRGGDYLFKDGRKQKLDRQVQKMVDTIAAYAFPFFKAHASLEAMATALRSGDYGFPHQVVYRLPVALALLGQHAEAQDSMRASLADLGDRQDLAAQDFRAFADAFTARPGPGQAY